MKLKSLNVVNSKICMIVLDLNHIVFGILLKCVMILQVVKITMNNIVQFIIRIVQFRIKFVLMVYNNVKITKVNKPVKEFNLENRNVYGVMIINAKDRV